jgi:hypothetical protein
MPAVNHASDLGYRKRFLWLYGLSVPLTLGHILMAALFFCSHWLMTTHRYRSKGDGSEWLLALRTVLTAIGATSLLGASLV